MPNSNLRNVVWKVANILVRMWAALCRAVRVLCRASISLARLLLWFSWGVGIGEGDKKAKTAIGEAISLLSLIIGGTVALGAAVRESGTTKTDYVWLYLLAAFLPLGAMTSILRGSNRDTYGTMCAFFRAEGMTMRHFYDRMTIQFTRWALGTCFVVVVAGTALAYVGLFPGQEVPLPRLLTIVDEDVKDYAWEYDGRLGIKGTVRIDESNFPKGIPDTLHLAIQLREPLVDLWGIWRIDLTEVTTIEAVESEKLVTSAQCHLDKTSPFRQTEYFSDFRKDGCTYLVEVYLHPFKEITKKERIAAKNAITEENAMTVVERPKS